jgi:hypothetical protein
MAYQVIRQPEFDAALARTFSSKMLPGYMETVTWPLERDPHIGKKVNPKTWMFKVLWAPIVVAVYYTIDDARKKVHLIGLRV